MPAVANGHLRNSTGGIMARTLAAFAAAMVTALMLTYAPARAEPQAGASAAVGQPLNITPSLRHRRQLLHTVEHPVAAKSLQQVPPQRVAHRRAVHIAHAVAA